MPVDNHLMACFQGLQETIQSIGMFRSGGGGHHLMPVLPTSGNHRRRYEADFNFTQKRSKDILTWTVAAIVTTE
jgi:hypothetical protein